MVEIFVDTANIDEIRTAVDWGICNGVTTNQKIFLAEGGVDFKRRVLEICSIVDGPVSVETTSNTVQDLLKEGREYSSWHRNVVVKVAMYGSGDGLRVVRQLGKEHIKTNMTCMMNFSQLFLASKAGANYVSLFFNRVRDAGEDPVGVIKNITSVMDKEKHGSRLIVGSIRKPSDVVEAITAGAHIVTIPFKILAQMPFHQKSEDTIKEFDEAWRKFNDMRISAKVD